MGVREHLNFKSIQVAKERIVKRRLAQKGDKKESSYI